MNANDLRSAISINGKIITKRCTEAYLSRVGLLEWLNIATPSDFTTVSDKIKFHLYGGGYCEVCGTRTNVDVSGRGFAKYCKDHFHAPKKGKRAHNAKEVDIELITKMYVKDQMSLLEISNTLGNISNVTLKKKLVEAGVALRTHAENQSIHSGSKGEKSFDFPREWWVNQYAVKTSETIARELGCSSSLVLIRLDQHGIVATNHKKDTAPETQLYQILDEIGVYYEKKNTSVLCNSRELDAWIPSQNLAVEINGAYWHSSARGKTSEYHLSKTIECESKGIQLIHLWDYEILNNPEAVASLLAAKLGKASRVFARKCEVRDVDTKAANKFLENHLQGSAPASIKRGLYYCNSLVAIATFGKPRYDKHHDLELIRFCVAPKTVVVGGLSKLLSTVSGSIVSYANRRWSRGNAYLKCDFDLIRITAPNYWYTRDFKQMHHRLKFQKSKLKEMPTYHENKSEHTIMEEAGYYRVWDCGQLVFSRK
jgi:very-short-patch-repair endonuclease